MQRSIDHHSKFVGIGLLLVVAAAAACSGEMSNPDQGSDAVVTARLWTGNAICDACLQIVGGGGDAGTGFYDACREDIPCRDAMADFTECYAREPAMPGCAPQMVALRSASSAGSALLDIFLLKCFFAHCETIRPLAAR